MFGTARAEGRRGGKGARAEAATVAPALHPTMLAKLLFRDLEPGRRLTVLDLGGASGDTVEIFSGFKSRLNFIDLLSELGEEGLNPDVEAEQLRGQLVALLGSADDTPFDVCLFWDVLNFLHPQTLAVFNECLAPRLHTNTVAHAYSVRSTEVPLSWASYGFQGEDMVSAVAKSGAPPLSFPHTPSMLNNTLTALRVDRGVLLRDGRLEVVLRPSDPEAEPTA